jgi:hypothetical protein
MDVNDGPKLIALTKSETIAEMGICESHFSQAYADKNSALDLFVRYHDGGSYYKLFKQDDCYYCVGKLIFEMVKEIEGLREVIDGYREDIKRI